MKTHWISEISHYSGQELSPLRNYLQFSLLGDSCLAWRGPCQIHFADMIDGEDLKQSAQICGSDMVHFVFEVFNVDLTAGVLLQRLFASIIADEIYTETQGQVRLSRSGDDLCWKENRKFSISIATLARQSALVHFAFNVSNKGTPVPTSALEDFGLDSKVSEFAQKILSRISLEWTSIKEATFKVRCL